MERVHPDHTEAIDKLLNEGKLLEASRVPKEAIQYWLDTLTQEVGAQRAGEIPFIAAALLIIINTYDKAFAGSKQIAEMYVRNSVSEALIYAHKKHEQ